MVIDHDDIFKILFFINAKLNGWYVMHNNSNNKIFILKKKDNKLNFKEKITINLNKPINIKNYLKIIN